MIRWVGLISLGVLLGLVSLLVGAIGLLLSLVAAIGAFAISPRRVRAQSGGVLLTSGALTAAALLGRIVLVDARDPAVSLGPGTRETFVAAIILGLVGFAVAIWGASRDSRTRAP
jgi:hypothetical protein